MLFIEILFEPRGWNSSPSLERYLRAFSFGVDIVWICRGLHLSEVGVLLYRASNDLRVPRCLNIVTVCDVYGKWIYFFYFFRCTLEDS